MNPIELLQNELQSLERALLQCNKARYDKLIHEEAHANHAARLRSKIESYKHAIEILKGTLL